MNIGTLTVLLGANTAGLSRAAVNMRRFEKQVVGSNNRIQASFAAVGSQMALTGAMITQYFTVPLGLIAGASVAAFGKFEAGLAKITGLVGISSKQVREWGNDMLEMAGKVGQSPTDLAQGLYRITSGGIRDSVVSMEVLTNAAKASTAGFGELQDLAKLTTSAINAYGQENLNAATAMDTFVAAVREGQLEAGEFTKNLGKAFPAAVKLGVGLEDVTASIASLTRTGTSTSEATSQIRRLLFTLIQATPKANDALSKLGEEAGITGLSFAKLRESVKEKGLLNALIELKKITGYDVEKLGDVFTRLRALLPVLDMLGPNLKNTITIFDSVGGSVKSFDNLVESASKTIAVKWKNAISGVKASFTNLGNVLKGPVMQLLTNFTDFIDRVIKKFTALTDAKQTNIIKWSAFVIALGPALIILGQLTVAFRTLYGIIASPIVFPILLLTAGVFALNTAAWALVQSWESVWARIKQGWENVGIYIGVAMNKIYIAILKGINWIDEFDWSKMWTGMWDSLTTFFDGYTQMMLNRFKIFFEDMKRVITAGKQFLEAADILYFKDITPTPPKIQPLLKPLVSGLDKLDAKPIVQEIHKIEEANRNLLALIEKNKLKYNTLLEGKEGFGDAFARNWNMQLETISETVTKGFTKLTGGIFEGLNKGANIGSVTGVRRAMAEIPSIKLWEDPNTLMPMKGLDPAVKGFAEVQVVLDKATISLAANKDMASDLGSEYDKLGRDITILQDALGVLTSPEMAGLANEDQIAAIKNMIAEFERLNVVQKEVVNTSALWKRALSEIASVFQQLGSIIGGAFGELINKIMPIVSLISKVIGLVQTLGKLAAVNAAAKTAESVATAGLAVSKAVAAGAGMPFPTNIAAIAAGVAAVQGALMAGIPAAKGAAMLADGGIVPGGYPNDTYPAMLTSGERVIPAKKLPDMQAQSINITVEGVTRGEDIYYIVKEVGRRQNNSF